MHGANVWAKWRENQAVITTNNYYYTGRHFQEHVNSTTTTRVHSCNTPIDYDQTVTKCLVQPTFTPREHAFH